MPGIAWLARIQTKVASRLDHRHAAIGTLDMGSWTAVVSQRMHYGRQADDCGTVTPCNSFASRKERIGRAGAIDLATHTNFNVQRF